MASCSTSTVPHSPSTWSPKKNYRVGRRRKGNGREYHHILFSPNTKKELSRMQHEGVGVLYRFKQDDKRYIGTTGRVLGRLNSHMSSANMAYRAHDDLDHAPLYTAIAKSPDTFQCGIIATTHDLSLLDGLETTAIKIQDTIENGFNRRNGGGGGTIAERDSVPLSEKEIRKISTIVQRAYGEVSWREIGRSAKNRIRFALTDREKKRQGGVYLFLHDDPVSSQKRVYVGETTDIISKRMSSHASVANNPTAKRHKAQEIYRHLHETPQECSLGLLPTEEIEEKYPGITPSQIEAVAVVALRTLGLIITNKNGGGGGGQSKKSTAHKRVASTKY